MHLTNACLSIVHNMNLIITFFVFIEKLDTILNLLEMSTKIIPVLCTTMLTSQLAIVHKQKRFRYYRQDLLKGLQMLCAAQILL